MSQLLAESDIVAVRRKPQRRPNFSPIIWLNLACLDAPIVAITWQWLFARSFHVSLTVWTRLALFLTAWVIYLADRFADASTLRTEDPRSLRQEFCLRHRRAWLGGIIIISPIDFLVVVRHLDSALIQAGIWLGGFSLLYLAVNYWLGKIWRVIPAKEICIGFLFAMGTVAGVFPQIGLSPGLVVSLALFATLCSFNCISIASWERELDFAQDKTSIATAWPEVRFLLRPCTLILGVVTITIALFAQTSAPLYGCIGASASLLGILDWFGEAIPRDERTAMADLVLLTPLLLIPLQSWYS